MFKLGVKGKSQKITIINVHAPTKEKETRKKNISLPTYLKKVQLLCVVISLHK